MKMAMITRKVRCVRCGDNYVEVLNIYPRDLMDDEIEYQFRCRKCGRVFSIFKKEGENSW